MYLNILIFIIFIFLINSLDSGGCGCAKCKGGCGCAKCLESYATVPPNWMKNIKTVTPPNQ
uniref:Uncharacterized protein n=1 Tax=viral metagenome TaxID=1070528 RepID=A0A6C0KHM0_9ZZZZ